jgi:hypothetical protein
MHFYTCSGCVIEKGECDHRDSLKAAVAGLGIRSLRHVCKARTPLYKPGDAVFVRTAADLGASGDEGEFFIGWYPGVVLGEARTKLLVFVKQGTLDETEDCPFTPRGNGVVKAPRFRVKPRPGVPPTDVTPCEWCGSVTTVGQACLIDPFFTPKDKCQALQRAATLEAA